MNIFEKQRLSVMAPMRDGVKLSCDIRFPDGDGPFPVILDRTPYNKAYSLTDPNVSRWTDQGYVYVRQDCRGKHESEGVLDPFAQEINDGKDTVDWVAKQDFCDGNVGMTGASYCGWTQLAAASTDPDALKVITPQVMSAESVESGRSCGGVRDITPVWWLLLNYNRSQAADPVGDWEEFYKNLPVNRMDEVLGFGEVPIFRKALNPETLGEVRQSMEIFEGLKSCDIPILLGVGWYDVFAAGSMHDAAKLIELRKQKGLDNYRVVAGPWGHGLEGSSTRCGQIDYGPDSMINLRKLQNAFIAHTIKGTPLPPELEKAICYFEMGSNVWKSADCWPPAESKEESWFVGSTLSANSLFGDGTLSKEPAGTNETDHYTYNPLNPTPTIGGAWLPVHETAIGPADQRPAERRDDVLCYTTEELTEPLTVTGAPYAELFVSSSAVDTDFIVRICDVYPDGRSMLICDGAHSLRCRDGLDNEKPAVPGECYKLRINLASTAIQIPAGHSLRMEITSSCFPRYVRNLNSAKHPLEETEADAVIAEQTIFQTLEKQSKLVLPVMPSL